MKKPNIKKIKCAIFQPKNESIKKITQKINETQNIKEKASLSKYLLKDVEDLLSCKYFDKKRSGCKICQYISKIRKKTAELILKVEQLKI
ncbi:MAG: hypothetical protein ABIJ84_01600 [bacterium]